MIKKRKKLDSITAFLLLSLIFHIGLWTTLHFVHETPSHHVEAVEVTYIPQTPTNPNSVEKMRQIVEQKDRINDEIDDKAKYLSAFNQKVIHETKSDVIDRFNNKVAGSTGTRSQQPTPKKTTKRPVKKVAKDKGELPQLRDLLPEFSPTPGTNAQAVATPGQAPSTDDHLKDVQKGLQTLLTTREFVYYSYYSRIKEQISQYWEPNVRAKVKIVYLEGRTIASSHDRVTQLLVTLDHSGNLIHIDVLTQSGVRALDDAAIEAFRSAAPFPNPPKGIVEKDGTIKIRWDFILES